MLYEMKKLLTSTGCGGQFLILLTLRCPFNAASTLIQASFLQKSFDAVMAGDMERLISSCAFFGIASACLFLYNGTIWSLYSAFVVRMEGVLRLKLFRKLLSFPYERIEATPAGEWITRLNIDVQMPFSRPLHLPHAVCAITDISVSSVMLLYVNPAIFGWVLLFVIPHIVTSQFITRAIQDLAKKSLEDTARNTGEFTAIINCADVAALYGGQEYLMRRYEESSRQLLRTNMRIRTRNAFSAAIVPLFGLCGYLTLLIVAGGWISDGLMTFGGLTAAFQYRGGVLAGSLMLINSLISIRASVAGIKRLNDTLCEKAEDSYE